MTKALAVANPYSLVPAKPLTQIEDLRKSFETLLRERVNVVSPVVQIDSIPAMCAVSLRAVLVDPSVNDKGNGPEVYKGGFCAKDERALGKVALEKIMAAAGVQVLGKLRLDDRSDPFYCEMEFTLGIRDLDGLWRQVTKSKAYDLRDGGADYQKIQGQNNWQSVLREARSNILTLTETKAQLRALRTLLHLKQKYTLDELAQPFIIPKLVPALDPSDPDQKAAMIDMALGRERQLYGPRSGDFTRALPGAPPQGTVTSDRALEEARPPHPPPPVGAATPVEEEEDADFDVPDLTPPKAIEPEIVVCTCPCGCQAALTAAVAATGIDRLGAPRCSDCFPALGRFNYERHKGLRVPLGLPKHPDLTADGVKEAFERAQAKQR